MLFNHCLALVRGAGLSFWLKTDTLAAKYFVCRNPVEEDLPGSLFTGSRDALWGDMKDWMVAPAFAETQLIMSAFVPACQGRIKTSPNTRPPKRSHNASKHRFRHMFTHINTDTDTSAQMHAGETHTQPIKRALFSHLMMLKMLVFHWLKHSKQTWRGDPTNKQTQSVFSAVNTARWGDVWLGYVWLLHCMGVCVCVCVWMSDNTCLFLSLC